MEKPQFQEAARSIRVAAIGPEQPTLAERFVGILHLPYVLGCTIWALVLFLIPTTVAMPYAPDFQHYNVPYLVVIFVLAVYFPLAVRFVRGKVIEAESQLIPLLPRGEADYHDAFGRTVSYRGQIICIGAIALMAIYIISLADILAFMVIDALCAIYVAIMLGSLIWFNLGCIIGLYQLGGKSLRFKPFREDPKLGAQAVGSLVLSLTGAYAVGVVILVLFSVVSDSKVFNSPYLWGIYGFFVLLGLAMFVVPLFRVHYRMAEEKSRQNKLIQGQFDFSTHELKTEQGEERLASIQRLLSLDMADRKLQAVSTWPFDTSLMGKLSVILLSVTAAVIARAIWAAVENGTKTPPG